MCESPPADMEALKYEGEAADRRSAVKWTWAAMGCPPQFANLVEQNPKDLWNGGTVIQIQKRLGLPDSCRQMIKRTLTVAAAGGDVRARRCVAHEKHLLSAVEHRIVADLTRSGYGLAQATAHINEFRAKHGLGRSAKVRGDDGTSSL